MKHEIEIKNLNAVATFNYTRIIPGQFSPSFGNYLPGEQASVKLTELWLCKLDKKVNIFDFLSGQEIEEIEDDLLKEMTNDPDQE